MKGKNLFYKDSSYQRKSLDEPCVFISHRMADLETARAVASYLTDTVAVNIYFSDDEEALQQADREQDHQKIVDYIQRGLDLSTHVLGIISNRTKGSWWVPFELGYS
ncbi:MAG: hypothetical protein ACFB15_02790 [Cyclobacteriaceae bacterium]